MPQTFHLDEDDEWEGTDVGPQEGRRGAEPFGHGWADRPSEPKVFAAARVAPKRTASDAPSTPAREPSSPGAQQPTGGVPIDDGGAIDSEQHLLDVFKVIDRDNSGTVSADELRGVLKRYVAKTITPEEVEGMIAQADKNGDGKVDYAEFMRIVQSGALKALGKTTSIEPTDSAPKPPPGTPARPQRVGYSATFHTGVDSGAGTDSNVYIQLIGETGVSGRIEVGNAKKKFEKGSVDTFPLPTKDVGNLVRIKVGHDNTGDGAGWQLKKVVVTEGDSTAPATPGPEAPRGPWTFVADAWIGGPTGKSEVEIDVVDEADSAGAGGGGGRPAGPGGFGGSPPASLTNSVKQLEKLTNEVSQIRDSLSQIERPAVEAETLLPGSLAGRSAPVIPERGSLKAKPRKLKGLAGVIAARNDRDKKRMDELVQLVQKSLGAMESSLEKRLEKLEDRVGEVNELTGALGGKKQGGGGTGGGRAGGGGGSSNGPGGDPRRRALELYKGYLGSQTTVACNLMTSLAEDLADGGRGDDEAEVLRSEAEAIQKEIKKNNMDAETELPQWCD